jgi:acyl-coenzyme A thioesterase PaaI-like protein
VTEEPQGEQTGSVSDLGISPPPPGGSYAKVRDDDPRYVVSEAVRRINALVVASRIGDEALLRSAEELERIADDLKDAAEPGRRPRLQPNPAWPAQDFFPTSPATGLANPIAPPILIHAVDGGLDGTAFFDVQYEGPPGCVHGGAIALAFDELLGAANIAAGSPGMTGTLTIWYRKPTPIRTELRVEARYESREGRKITTTGRIYNGEELTAESQGIFIELSADKFFARVEKYGNHDEPFDRSLLITNESPEEWDS